MFKSLFGKAASRVVVSVALVAFQSCVFCAFLLCICSVKCKLRFYCAIAYKMYMKCRMPKFSSCLGACVVASNYLNLLKTMRLVNYWFGICLNFWEQKKKRSVSSLVKKFTCESNNKCIQLHWIKESIWTLHFGDITTCYFYP